MAAKRLCRHCRSREATTRFVEQGGALNLVHGNYEWWCEVCVLERKIAYAEERAAALPELRERLSAAVARIGAE